MKYKFLCLLLLIPFLSYAQLDSLKEVYSNSQHDSMRVVLLGKIGRYFETVNFDSSLYYYNKGLDLARTPAMKQYPVYEGRISESIGFAYIYGQRNMKDGLDWMRKGFKIHQASSNLEESIKTAYNLGFMFNNQELYDSVEFYYKYAIEQNKQLKHPLRLHESYNNLGLCYYYQARYEVAAYYLLKGTKLKEELGETKEVQHSYINLGNIFLKLDEYDRAKKYFKKAENIMRGQDYTYGVALSVSNYASCLVGQDSFDLATLKYKEGFELYKKIGHQFGMAQYYENMSTIAYKKEQYQQYHDYLLQSEEEFPKDVAYFLATSVYNNIARAKLLLLDSVTINRSVAEKKKLLLEATDYATKAWKSAEEINDLDDLLVAASTLTNTYERQKNYPKALFYAKEWARLNEEVNAKAKTSSMADMMTKYETEKVESENDLLKQQEIANNAKLKQQQTFTIASILVAGLLAILAFVIYRSREKVNVSRAIAEASLAKNELLLKEIHHRVKNNLQIVSSLLNLQTKNTEDESALEAMKEGQNRVKAMALIHQGLYQHEDIATIQFQDYAQQLLQQLSGIYTLDKPINTSVTGENTSLDIDTAVPLGLILNELITNSFKYAFQEVEECSIAIQLSQGEEKGSYQLKVTDNGQGLPKDFDWKKTKSIGLRLIRRLSKQLYGNFDYQYQDGAIFTISFKDTVTRQEVA